MKTLRLLTLLVVATTILSSPSLLAQETSVRVLFYTGSVVKGKAKVSLGQQLGARDVLTLGKGATLQLSVNGRVIRYDAPGRVNVADAIRQAKGGENGAVATTARTLAAASGAGRGGRTSQAGATRLDDSSRILSSVRERVITDARTIADAELARSTGIEAPIAKAEELIRSMYGEDDMVILQPRATAVTSGPVRFRWLRSPSAGGYVVTVFNHLGDKIFEQETRDTTLVWESPALLPDVVYTWRLTDTKNSLHRTGATFSRLTSEKDREVSDGIASITKELGETNPALPVVLAAYLAENDCIGEASSLYCQGAERTPEHYGEMMVRAIDLYENRMYLRPTELALVVK